MKNTIIFGLIILTASCARSGTNYNETAKKDKTINNGYTTTSEHNNTGAVSSVDVDNGTLSLDMYLQRVPGLTVKGKGSNATVQLRGVSSFLASTEPIFVVSGNVMDYASAYNMVSPYDIKNINVLKDAASTSIYGSRGSNGVVVISLKKGDEEEKKKNRR